MEENSRLNLAHDTSKTSYLKRNVMPIVVASNQDRCTINFKVLQMRIEEWFITFGIDL